MSKDAISLLMMRVGAFLYSIIVIYQIYAGIVRHWSVLALPVIVLLVLWRPRRIGWFFLWVAFLFYFFYYCLNFITVLAVYIGVGFLMVWWPGVDLPFLGDNTLIWLVKILVFLAAAIFVGVNKHLFHNHRAQPPSLIQKACVVLLAATLPFLPWLEQKAWNTFDPRVLDNQREIKSICFSPDGKTIGVINGGLGPHSINIWNVETKSFILLPAYHNEKINSLHFSPDGKYAALGYGQAYGADKLEPRETVKIELWELATGNKIEFRRTEPVDSGKDIHRQVNKVSFSPDSAYLACSAGDDREFIEIWDIHSGKLVNNFDTGSSSRASDRRIAYSPDGKAIASKYAYGKIAIWNIEAEGTARRLIEGYYGIIEELAYSPDGRYLAAAFNKKWPGSKAGSDKGFIDIWDVSAGKIVKSLQWDSDRSIQGLAYSPDGRYIASFLEYEDVVTIWDLTGGSQSDTLIGPVYEQPITDVAYSPDGKYLAVANGQYLKLYNLNKQEK